MRFVAHFSLSHGLLTHRYKAYRDDQEKLHNEWLERVKIRKEKIARGEKVGPEEKDPTEPEEVGCLGILKFFLYLIVFGALAGKFFTGSYTWDHENRLAQLKTFIPVCDVFLASYPFE